jgi:hypothetical protein
MQKDSLLFIRLAFSLKIKTEGSLEEPLGLYFMDLFMWIRFG